MLNFITKIIDYLSTSVPPGPKVLKLKYMALLVACILCCLTPSALSGTMTIENTSVRFYFYFEKERK